MVRPACWLPSKNDYLAHMPDEDPRAPAKRGALRAGSPQVVNNRVETDVSLTRPSGETTVVHQLAELLRLYSEDNSDFDAVCPWGWPRKGVTNQQIREFCEWRKGAPLIVNCHGQLLGSSGLLHVLRPRFFHRMPRCSAGQEACRLCENTAAALNPLFLTA